MIRVLPQQQTVADPGIPPDDAAVIARSARDVEEFGAIFDRHAVAIHSYIARRAGPELADDLTAETFLTALRRRAAYDSAQSDARPWLYGIATNLLHRHRRQEVRHYRALARTGVDPVADSHADMVATASPPAPSPRTSPPLSPNSPPATATRCCSSPGAASPTPRSPTPWPSRSARSDHGSTARAANCAPHSSLRSIPDD
jgi:DNA-directed RNA polymerase specialized sigma24 family protein